MDTEDQGAQKRGREDASPTKISPAQKKQRETSLIPTEEEEDTRPEQTINISETEPQLDVKGIKNILFEINQVCDEKLRPQILDLEDKIHQNTEKKIRQGHQKLKEASPIITQKIEDLSAEINNYTANPDEAKKELVRKLIWSAKRLCHEQITKTLGEMSKACAKNTRKDIKSSITQLVRDGTAVAKGIKGLSKKLGMASTNEDEEEEDNRPPSRSNANTDPAMIRKTLEASNKQLLEEKIKHINTLRTKACDTRDMETQTIEDEAPTERSQLTPTWMILLNVPKSITKQTVQMALEKETSEATRHLLEVKAPRTNKAGYTSIMYLMDRKDATVLIKNKHIEIDNVKIKTREFTIVPCCPNCQKISGHTKETCPHNNQGGKVCHRCAETGHTVKKCAAHKKACYNCREEGHAANSTLCPIYRELLREYRKEIGTKGQ